MTTIARKEFHDFPFFPGVAAVDDGHEPGHAQQYT